MRKKLLFSALVCIGIAPIQAQIDSTLGIGITPPQGTLHIHSLQPVQDAMTITPASISGAFVNHYQTIFHITNPNVGTTSTDGFSIIQHDDKVTLRQFESNSLHILGYNEEGITITSTGKVGIGTQSPSNAYRLHVEGNTYLNGTATIASRTTIGSDCQTLTIGKAHVDNLAWGSAYIGFNAQRSGSSWSCKSNTWLNGGAVIWATMYGDILFANLPSTDSLPKSGIPDSVIKAHVNLRLGADGTLSAKAINVTMSNWPDYVFHEDYPLQGLSETEKYIKENGHLPNIPTAQEVQTEGVNLGEMNKLLLLKVEELTLIVIDLQKQINELKGQ